MAQQFLDHAQVSAALEQVCRRTVPQTVRTQVWGVGHVGEKGVHHLADLARIHPAAPPAEEERRTTVRGGDPAACRAHAERFSWSACAAQFLAHLVPAGV